MAIDESGEATDGNIYVTQSLRDVVDVFSSEGEYLGQLSESAEGGAFGEPCGVAVDAAGTVYVGDRGDDLIHVFEPAANPPVNGDSTASYATLTDPCTIAAGAGATVGSLFVTTSNGSELFKLDAATGEVKYQIASGARTAGVDPSTGHLLAARSSMIDRYDASGAAEAELLATIPPGSTPQGVAVNATGGEIYLSRTGTENVEVYDGSTIVTQPEVTTEAASGLVGKNATLNGSVNPDGVELSECFFEWGPTTAYGEIAPCAESPAEIGTGEEPVAVHADLAGLDVSSTYHFRLAADNAESDPAAGADVQFSTPDPVITEPASGVSDAEATLNGSVNPDGEQPSECTFEWGTSEEYGQIAPCVPAPAGIGTGEEPVAVEADLAGLNGGTTYHFRLVAVFSGGPLAGEDETFQTLGPVLGETWVEDVIYTEARLKAEIDPEGVKTTYHFEYGTTEAYGSETPERTAGSDNSLHEVTAPIAGLAPGTEYHYRVVASSAEGVNAGPDRVLTSYERPPAPETGCPNQVFRDGPAARLPDCRAYELVSAPDKGGASIEFKARLRTEGGFAGQHLPLAADDGEAAAYAVWDTFSAGEPVGNTVFNEIIARRGPEGWRNLSLTPANDAANLALNFSASGTFTPDLGAMTLRAPRQTTVVPESSSGTFNTLHRRTAPDGVWRQVSLNVPPNQSLGQTDSPQVDGGWISADGTHVVFAAPYDLTGEGPGQFLWREAAPEELVKLPENVGFGDKANFRHAISADGSRIFTDSGAIVDLGPERSAGLPGSSEFRYASLDGSIAFYEDAGVLYRWDVDADELAQLTEMAGAGTKVLGGAEDGSRLYFVVEHGFPPGAEGRKLELYLWSEDGTPDGELTYVVTGEEVDTGVSRDTDSIINQQARFSADGRYIVFAEKNRRLTGYPNEGYPELYLYDAVEEELECVSCIPSGEPAGSSGTCTACFPPGEKAAGSHLLFDHALKHRELYVTDDGRVFFHTSDALLPRDVNGRTDVYEYDSEAAELSLLSTGTHGEDSFFVGIGASGRDAFFTTAESLVGIDVDGVHDIYDARSGGGLAAQHPADPPAPCLGEACQNIPAPPELPTPASATFRGAGDPVARPDCGARARKAARLSRRAKRARKAAARSAAKRRSQRLLRRSARLAKKAKRASRGAKRCRQANRRRAGK